MDHRVKQVIPMEDMLLKVQFQNDDIKIYDVKPLLGKLETFKVLQNKEIFNQVEVDTNGYGIKWNEDIDLSCDELWENDVEYWD